MAIRKIITVPDEILRKRSREVTVFDERLHTLLDDMFDTLQKANGAGLAGPQVAVLKRIALVLTDEIFLEMINPVIINSSGNQDGYEGCLSIPKKGGSVSRPNIVTVKFQDRNGKFVQKTVEGFDARAVCHELDHLDGVLYTDKATEVFDD